jgi:hypothetical protein
MYKHFPYLAKHSMIKGENTMKTKIYSFFTMAFLAFVFTTGSETFAQGNPYRVSNNQVQTLLNRLETRTDNFRRVFDRSLDNSRVDGTRYEENITEFVTNFENATDQLRSNFAARNSAASDVREVLDRAVFINNYMMNNQISVQAQNQWNLIRNDLNTLANYYNVSWNWNNRANARVGRNNRNNRNNFPLANNIDTRLTGTYRLNSNQSDNVNNIVNQAITSSRLNINQQDRVRRNLERRLTPPDMLALEKRGQQVSLASSMSPQVSFAADNVSRSETNPNGRTVQTRVSATSNEVTINYEGDRMNDFYVSFAPLGNGQLRVTRRVYLENTNTAVTATSVYDKTTNVAQWSAIGSGNYDGNTNGNINTDNNTGNLNDFVVPGNTRITAVLRNAIDTKVIQNGDRFQLEVTSPSQYRGAIIEGRIANADQSGRVSGRANLSMEFDTIRLNNGQTYRFAGFIDSIRDANGDNVQVNSEGTVRDSNQTTRTVTRAGIGAALGAIIGAVAGGGQGAAIGAAVGAGAGAGTVILQGRDNIELGQGSEFGITASAPNNFR